MIIECPSCKTKFSVDQTQLEGVAAPRFHCSRCDHFFELSMSPAAEKPKPAVTKIPAEPFEIAPPTQMDFLSSPPASPTSSYPEESSSARTSLFSSEQMASEDDFSADQFSSSNVTAAWPDEGVARSNYEVDLSQYREGGPAIPSAREIVEDDNSMRLEDEKAASFREAKAPGFEDDETIADYERRLAAHSVSLEGLLREEDDEVISPSAGRASVLNFPASSVAAEKSPEAYSTGRGKRVQPIVDDELAFRSAVGTHAGDEPFPASKRSSLKSSVWSLMSFPAALMVLFLIWSHNLEATPKAIESFFEIRPQGLPQLAPAGLELTDLASNVVTLDDGKRALEIKGNLLNATAKSFSRVRLDARVFAGDNRELHRLIVNAKNEILQAKVEGLTEANILRLQEKDEVSGAVVSPSSRLPFRIVFPNIQEEDVKWFMARIYSCEPVRT